MSLWPSSLPPLAHQWQSFSYDKWWLSEALGITDDGLHMHAGLLLLMLAATLLRRPPWHWAPWLVVAAVETANEAHDMLQRTSATLEGSLRASSHDWWMTLAWPTVILLVFPRLIRRYRTE